MGHACTHDDAPGPNGQEHPVVAVLAILAIVAAISEPSAEGDLPVAPKADLKPDEERELDAAVTSSRFATGFSP
jgi:hypothetical protein